MTEELRTQIEKEVKLWAKNNLCALCYANMEEFINDIEDIIENVNSEGFIQECIVALENININVTDEIIEYIRPLIQKEAKYRLNDYYKHEKDYD